MAQSIILYLLIAFSAVNSSISLTNYKKSKLNAHHHGRASRKDLAVQVTWPNESDPKKKTVTLKSANDLDSILNKITRGVIDDNCPEGINCIGKDITGAVDKVLGILAIRLGRTGSIGYKSEQKSKIKRENIKWKLDDDSFLNMDDEDDKQVGKFDEPMDKMEKKKNKLKLSESISKLEDEDEKQNGSDDEQIYKIKKEKNKWKLGNSMLKLEVEYDKQNGSNNEQIDKIEKENNISKMGKTMQNREDEENNQDASVDEQIDRIKKKIIKLKLGDSMIKLKDKQDGRNDEPIDKIRKDKNKWTLGGTIEVEYDKQDADYNEEIDRIKKKIIKLKLDNSMIKLKDKEAKQDNSNDEQIEKIKKKIIKMKLYHSISKLKDKENNQDRSDDEQIDENKNLDNKEDKKYVSGEIIHIVTENLNPTESLNVADRTDNEKKEREEDEPTTKGVEYILFGGNKVFPVPLDE